MTKLNLNKKTGDTLTATEVNQIGASVDQLYDHITEYNVSKLHPTGGIDGTNKYTLELAIKKIPAEYQSVGIKCSFVNSEGLTKLYMFQGGEFIDSTSWSDMDSIFSSKMGSSRIANKTEAIAISDEEHKYINSLDTISILTVVKPTKHFVDWYRYMTFLSSTQNYIVGLGYDGGWIVIEGASGGIGSADINRKISSYKNICIFNKKDGMFSVYNDMGKDFSVQSNRLKIKDFLNSKEITQSSGDRDTAFVETIIFNFDIGEFNDTLYGDYVTNWLRNINQTKRIPSIFNFGTDFRPKRTEKFKSALYRGYNKCVQEQDSEGYWHIKTTAEGLNQEYSMGSDTSLHANRAVKHTFIFEVLNGKLSKLGYSILSSKENALLYIKKNGVRIDNTAEIGIGVYEAVFLTNTNKDSRFYCSFNVLTDNSDVKLISHEIRPLAAIIRLTPRIYQGEIVDDVVSVTRAVKVGAKKNDCDISEMDLTEKVYGIAAPDRKPNYVGEKWVDTSTGDIYEAGNLTAFKKISNV